MFGGTIGGLQRYASYREGRANLHDAASISGKHAPQRCESAMDITEIVHFSHATEFGGLHFLYWREDRNHCVVNPDVDRTETLLKGGSGGFHGLIIAHIGGIGCR